MPLRVLASDAGFDYVFDDKKSADNYQITEI